MIEEVTPRKVQNVARLGFENLNVYRRARAMFIKEYVGQYYKKQAGLTGSEPINLIFNAIRVLVPNMVMKTPVTKVVTRYTEQKPYAELLGLALDSLDIDLNLKDILRTWIVDAIFSIGIVKTGICDSGQILTFGDINVDPGQLFVERVDLDDFTFDPTCTVLTKAAFLGSRVRVPRQYLLDFDSFNHDLVMKLPKTSANSARDIRGGGNRTQEMLDLQDSVDVVELWIPKANALVTIPDPRQAIFDEYLSIKDYYGPSTGPYTFLSMTPPVPNFPLPVAPVSLWYDLHCMANRMFIKSMNQADRQKDLVFYAPSASDSAKDVREAEDGDVLATDDPKAVTSVSVGGQNSKNVDMLSQLQVWFNYVAGNPDQLAGLKSDAKTATQASILQSNAAVSIEDCRDITYAQTAEIKKKLAWYLHTDPLIELPLIQRKEDGRDIQIILTPEQRIGDYLNFTFQIVARSMSRLDPRVRTKNIMDFCTNILPAAVNSAMLMMQLGQPFNLQRYLSRIADEMDIGPWVQDLFNDPEFQQKLKVYMSMGPQNQGKGMITTKGIAQNGGFPETRNNMTPGQQFNQQSQEGAAESQSMNQGM